MLKFIQILTSLLCVALLNACGSGVCPIRSNCRIASGGGVQWVAPSGSIDTSFGTAGVASTDFFATNDTLQSIALQSDGKVVVTGYTTNGANPHLAIARFSAAGILDTTFGTSGKVFQTYNFNGDYGQSVLIQPDNKIMIAGETFNGVGTYNLTSRFTSAGVMDTTYGAGGYFQDTLSAAAIASNATLLSNNDILATFHYAPVTMDFALLKILASGALDTTFGTGGYVSTDFNGFSDFSYWITTDSSGRILVAGKPFNFTQDFGITRYTSQGVLDTTFGTAGKTIVDFASFNDSANSILVQSDGKIILVGEAINGGHNNFALLRLTSSGILDTTFGAAGFVISAFTGNNDRATAAALQPDGKIIAVGTANVAGTDYFAIARYKTDGNIDTSFGTAGLITTHIGAGNNSVTSVALQPDGKIVVGGYANVSGTQDFIVLRIK
jgi:uncharacterized delta-60 repeat protein